jgi:hypothetical protein
MPLRSDQGPRTNDIEGWMDTAVRTNWGGQGVGGSMPTWTTGPGFLEHLWIRIGELEFRVRYPTRPDELAELAVAEPAVNKQQKAARKKYHAKHGEDGPFKDVNQVTLQATYRKLYVGGGHTFLECAKCRWMWLWACQRFLDLSGDEVFAASPLVLECVRQRGWDDIATGHLDPAVVADAIRLHAFFIETWQPAVWRAHVLFMHRQQ